MVTFSPNGSILFAPPSPAILGFNDRSTFTAVVDYAMAGVEGETPSHRSSSAA